MIVPAPSSRFAVKTAVPLGPGSIVPSAEGVTLQTKGPTVMFPKASVVWARRRRVPRARTSPDAGLTATLTGAAGAP